MVSSSFSSKSNRTTGQSASDELARRWVHADVLVDLERLLRHRRSLTTLILAALLGAFVAILSVSQDQLTFILALSIVTGLAGVAAFYMLEVSRILRRIQDEAASNRQAADAAMRRLNGSTGQDERYA